MRCLRSLSLTFSYEAMTLAYSKRSALMFRNVQMFFLSFFCHLDKLISSIILHFYLKVTLVIMKQDKKNVMVNEDYKNIVSRSIRVISVTMIVSIFTCLFTNDLCIFTQLTGGEE
jgi:hypothetical protein